MTTLGGVLFDVRRRVREGSWPLRFFLVFLRYWARRFSHLMSSGSSKRSHPVREEQIRVVVINLDRRVDRLAQVAEELEKLGRSDFGRFAAIEEANGMLGCARSHLGVLELPFPEHTVLMVCEDDIGFSCDSAELVQKMEAFSRDPGLDVLSLSYSQAKGRLPIGSGLQLATSVRTTACYVIKKQAVKKLRKVFLKSERRLQRGLPNFLAAVDVIWDDSQWWNLNFSVSDVSCCHQVPSYSDIENQWVDYGQL